jgi:hypothetical protein
MRSHNGCEFIFLINSDLGLLVVPTRMGVLKPSDNGLYMLSHTTLPEATPPVGTSAAVDISVALTAHSDPLMWHPRFGNLNMQNLHSHRCSAVLGASSELL